MMKKTVFLILFLLSAGMVVSAQSDCDGLPCGSIPWSLPPMPELVSPTPIATNVAPEASISNPSPSTATPTPNVSGIGDGSGDVTGMLTATAMTVEMNGTPYSTDFNQLADDSSMIISYAKAITAADFGVITPLLQFVVFTMVLTLAVKLIELTLPLASLALGALRKITQVILDFLPF